MDKIIFVSDMFSGDFLGGAELTTEAIIGKSPFDIIRIRSREITENFIIKNSNKKWIFGNFWFVENKILFKFLKSKITYDLIEYDYKFCDFRSPQKHEKALGKCDCEFRSKSKLVSLFMKGARNCWFMSEDQMMFYLAKFSFLDRKKMHVLSSVFSDKTIEKILNLKYKKTDSYLIMKTSNWIKGMDNAIAFAKSNNLKYHTIGQVTNDMMLEELARSKGLIFMPNGFDTCPRITIEAKLLDCELVLNDNVQHSKENWFSGSKEITLSYLKTNCDKLWGSFND